MYFSDRNASRTSSRGSVAPTHFDILPWSQIVAGAIESDDDHVIKLVDSCRELEAALGVVDGFVAVHPGIVGGNVTSADQAQRGARDRLCVGAGKGELAGETAHVW